MSKYSPLISRTLRKLSQEQLEQLSNEDWDTLLEIALTPDSENQSENQTERSNQPADKALISFDKKINEAIVVKAIEPYKMGQIRFQGAWWSARCVQQTTLFPGEVVKVVGRQNITLLVQPTRTSSQDEQVNLPFQFTQTNELAAKTESKLNKVENNRLDLARNFVEKGDRTIAFSAGGAFLGGLIAQIPGAIVGALVGAIFGWFEKDKPATSSEDSR